MTASATTNFAQLYPITDLCFLVDDVERAIAFYVGKLGFQPAPPRRRASPTSRAPGLTLALWEIGHISAHTGISGHRGRAARAQGLRRGRAPLAGAGR